MDAMHMSPADQNDGAVTETINPSEDEKAHSPEEAPQEDANDEDAEDEAAKPH